jgi:hypothetical protein
LNLNVGKIYGNNVSRGAKVQNATYTTGVDERLIREAAQWIIIQKTRRSLTEIAEEAGCSVNMLKYYANRLMQKEGLAFNQPSSDRTNEPTGIGYHNK